MIAGRLAVISLVAARLTRRRPSDGCCETRATSATRLSRSAAAAGAVTANSQTS